MASNKVIINSEANSVVISEPVEGSRIVKVIAAGPQGARGEGFNTVSASLNTRLDSLETFSSSLDATFATDAQLTSLSSSVSSSIGSLSASIAVTDLAQNVRLDSLEASIGGGGTGIGSRVGSLEVESGSIRSTFNSFTSSYTIVSTSLDSRLDNLESFSSSLNDSFATDIELAAVSASLSASATLVSSSISSSIGSLSGSVDNRITILSSSIDSRIIAVSSSLSASITQLSASFDSRVLSLSSSLSASIDTLSGSLSGSISLLSSSLSASINSLSSSVDDRILTLSSSLSSSIMNLSQSVDNRLDSIEAVYATTGSNTFVGNQIVSGNLNVNGSVTATEFYTTYVSSSILYTSGSTKFGDTQDDNHNFTGSVYVSQSLTVYGTEIVSGSVYVSGGVVLPNNNVSASNINVGNPTSNTWQANLNGSYFNNFDSNTNVSDILRFVAGLLSASAPDASPNTRTWNSLSSTALNTTTGTALVGYVPQSSTNTTITYLNSKGFATVGSTMFSGVGTIYTNSSYGYTYSSTAGGTTIVTSSADAQLFGLGLMSSGTPTSFKVSGSFNFWFSNASNKVTTSTSASNLVLTQIGEGTTNGITLAKINTVNPNVIPPAYQDGKFVSVMTQSLYNGGLSGVSGSGYYEISASISIASGSSNYTTTKTSNAQIFYAPLTTISSSVGSNNITTGSTTISSVSATSSSLSGVPYLSTATWRVSSSLSGVFNPMFYNGAVGSIGYTGTGITMPSGDYNATTAGGLITSTNTMFDSTGVTLRNTSTIPYETDIVKLNGLISFSAGTSTNTSQSGSSGNTFSYYINGRTFIGTLIQKANTSNYHDSGSFGQPVASGSMLYYGAANTPTTLIEYFNAETYRRVISNSTSLTTAWNSSTPLILGSNGDLQVKPGYLVNPESSDGYWYSVAGYSSSNYKWYLREFDTAATSNKATLTITLLPGTSADLVDFSTTTGDKIAVGVIFAATPSVIFDVVKGNGSYGGSLNSQTTGYTNPFSDSVSVKGDFSSFTNSAGTLTLGLTNAIGQTINASNTKIWLLVRYKGKPANPLTRISVAVS